MKMFCPYRVNRECHILIHWPQGCSKRQFSTCQWPRPFGWIDLNDEKVEPHQNLPHPPDIESPGSVAKVSVIAERHSFETVLFIGTEKIALQNLLAEVVIRGLRSVGVKVEESE